MNFVTRVQSACFLSKIRLRFANVVNLSTIHIIKEYYYGWKNKLLPVILAVVGGIVLIIILVLIFRNRDNDSDTVPEDVVPVVDQQSASEESESDEQSIPVSPEPEPDTSTVETDALSDNWNELSP